MSAAVAYHLTVIVRWGGRSEVVPICAKQVDHGIYPVYSAERLGELNCGACTDRLRAYRFEAEMSAVFEGERSRISRMYAELEAEIEDMWDELTSPP